MTSTKTYPAMVAHYREAYADQHWTPQDGKAARGAAVAACKANALAALAQAETETDPALAAAWSGLASAWIALAQLDSYTYRAF